MEFKIIRQSKINEKKLRMFPSLYKKYNTLLVDEEKCNDELIYLFASAGYGQFYNMENIIVEPYCNCNVIQHSAFRNIFFGKLEHFQDIDIPEDSLTVDCEEIRKKKDVHMSFTRNPFGYGSITNLNVINIKNKGTFNEHFDTISKAIIKKLNDNVIIDIQTDSTDVEYCIDNTGNITKYKDGHTEFLNRMFSLYIPIMIKKYKVKNINLTTIQIENDTENILIGYQNFLKKLDKLNKMGLSKKVLYYTLYKDYDDFKSIEELIINEELDEKEVKTVDNYGKMLVRRKKLGK